jgi:hypothetical protein
MEEIKAQIESLPGQEKGDQTAAGGAGGMSKSQMKKFLKAQKWEAKKDLIK